MHEAYATALHTSARGKSRDEQMAVFDALVVLLKKRGHESLMPKIYRAFVARTQIERGKDEVELTVAHESQRTRFDSEIRDLAKKHFGDVRVSERAKIDDTLIGGYVIRKDDKEVDASYKKHLLSLFNALRGEQS